MTDTTAERLSGQIKAQNILIHVLLGRQVLQTSENGTILRESVRAALLATRRGVAAASDEERRGSIETFEEALKAIEFVQTGGDHK